MVMHLNIFHSGGLWIIPLGLLLACLWTLYRANKASKSGSIVGGSYSDPIIRDGGGNLPIYKTAQFKFAVILFIAFIVTVIWIASDYKGV